MNSLQRISNELSTKLNEIRLQKNHPLTKNKLFILLEGNTDIKLFRKFFNIKTSNINQINGKDKIIKALKILQNEGIKKIIGIKDADFDNFIEIIKCNISINKNNLFKELKKYSDINLDNQELEEIINNLKKISNKHLQICNGHDITNLLAKLLNRINKSNINIKKVEEALRLSYNINEFQKTKLFYDLDKWQKTNNIESFINI